LTSLLLQLIIERIQHNGPITFAEYMRMALYEPGYGYYVTDLAKMGWEGDYYTSTDVSPLFAHCMGRQLQQMWEQLGKPAPFTVLEQGAGRGDLGREIYSWAAQANSAFYAALDYHTTDIHSGMDAINRVPTARAINCQTDGMFLAPSVLLSNELVDAFPVHIIEKCGDRLYEVFVSVQDGRLCEVLDEPSSADIADYLDGYKIAWRTFEDGWRAEINLQALCWIEQAVQLLQYSQVDHQTNANLMLPAMSANRENANGTMLGMSHAALPRRKRRGFLLTIDYGDSARKLYTRQRRRGTLACYYHHQLTDRPLARPGAQDLTAHVNFTALISQARRHGLRLQTFTTQQQWLTDMQIYEELEQIRQRDFAIIDQARASDQGQIALLKWYDLRQRAAALTAPDGMGDFKVMTVTC
jgi:SAM-dependent MidA family methyltransferase